MWTSVIIFVVMILALSQTILYATRVPVGIYYPLVHNFPEDYYYYLHIMRQGWEGAWTVTSRLTPELHPSVVVAPFFLFLGMIARVVHLSLPLMYTLSRLGGGIALLVCVAILIHRVYPKQKGKQLVSLLFVAFGTYFWGWGRGEPTVATLAHTWTELDPIFRWSFVPHHLWSKVGMLAVFILLLRTRSSVPSTILLALVVFITGMTNPVVHATLIPVVGLWFLLEFGQDRTLRRVSMQLLPWIVVGVVSVGVIAYHRYLEMHVFPWTSYLLWEQTFSYRVNPIEYAGSLGPTLILFILAIPAIWRLGRVGRLLLAWAAGSWIMLYIVGPFVPFTPERYLGGYQFIPLGIGATVSLFLIRTRLIRMACIVLLFIYFAFGLRASFIEHMGYVAANRNNIQVYVPRELMDAFRLIEQNSIPDDVVAAPYEISTMIPAFTGRRVVAGHQLMTQHNPEKVKELDRFFSFQDTVFAWDFLTRYRVREILIPKNQIPDSEIVTKLHLRLIKNYSSYNLYHLYE